MTSRYHLLLQGEHWALLEEGGEKPIRTFWTKKEGVSYGLSYVEQHGGSLVIHKLDGGFQEEHAYPGFEPRTSATPPATTGSQPWTA